MFQGSLLAMQGNNRGRAAELLLAAANIIQVAGSLLSTAADSEGATSGNGSAAASSGEGATTLLQTALEKLQTTIDHLQEKFATELDGISRSTPWAEDADLSEEEITVSPSTQARGSQTTTLDMMDDSNS